jgi:hypothetical protein
MLLRTAKSCGPDTPMLVSSSRSCVGPTGLRQNHIRGTTVAREPGHRGEREISRKTIACGNAGRFRCTRCYSCAFYHYKCTRGRGCIGHPAFPTPSFGAEDFCKARAHRAARLRSCVFGQGRGMRSPDAAQRAALRGVCAADPGSMGRGSAVHREERCTASGTRGTLLDRFSG